MKISITKLKETAILPEYQTTGAAGMDLHACIGESMTFQPGERKLVPTGLAISLPRGYEAQIRARSGMSIKYGMTMVNGVGTIDADYRGEIGVLMINLGQDAFAIEPNMRVAQMIVAQYERVEWREVGELDATDRGGDGFGSTGVKHVA